MTPYEILGISPDSDDKTIRRAYLDLVREHPPERDPERFKEIVQAYDAVKDESRRLKYYLFNKEIPVKRPMEALMEDFRKLKKRKPPCFEKLKELLRDE